MNDKKLITNRLLGLCGVALLACWALKLWGKVVFDFVVTNETMISVCNFIENSVVQYIIYWAFYIFSSMIILLSICQKKTFTKRQTLIFVLIYSGIFGLNFVNAVAKMIVDSLVTIMLPIVVFRKKWWHSLLLVVSVVLTQFVLLQIRNIDYTLYGSNFINGFLMQIDYYIMLLIIYIRRTI